MTVVAQEPEAVEPPRPNIVMVLIDDANPHDGRLWSAPYMPRLDQLIVSRGIRFTDFHGEIPLCGPSRASLLTGQHGHNSGGLSNNGQHLDVSTTIATELEADDSPAQRPEDLPPPQRCFRDMAAAGFFVGGK